MANFPFVSRARVIGANDRIGVGFIGVGGRGRSHVGTVQKLSQGQENVGIVAVNDAFRYRLDEAVKVTGAKAYMKHADLLADLGSPDASFPVYEKFSDCCRAAVYPAHLWISGERVGDHLGYAASAGDYNLDGSRDIAMGAPDASRDGLRGNGVRKRMEKQDFWKEGTPYKENPVTPK